MRGALALLLLLVPATAEAYSFGSETSSTGQDTFELRVGAQMFLRARARRPDRGSINEEWDIQRARLKTSFRYGEWLRVDIEPDFGGTSADLADVFLQVNPVKGVDVRIGQAKAPWGIVEIEGRWDLPVLTRGTISEVISDRIGFGRRKFGARLRWRGKKLPMKPSVEVGTYGQQGVEIGDDFAARVGFRPLKKLRVHVYGYSRKGAQTDGRRGHGAALSVLYDRRGLYLLGEVQTGRVRLLSRTGIETGVDATFLGARAIAGYELKVAEDFGLEPFLAGDALDTNLSTRDDIAVGFRLGFNAWWRKRLRLGVQWGRETGQLGAVTRPASALIVLLGAVLD